jgi:hypothetical protein
MLRLTQQGQHGVAAVRRNLLELLGPNILLLTEAATDRHQKHRKHHTLFRLNPWQMAGSGNPDLVELATKSRKMTHLQVTT